MAFAVEFLAAAAAFVVVDNSRIAGRQLVAVAFAAGVEDPSRVVGS